MRKHYSKYYILFWGCLAVGLIVIRYYWNQFEDPLEAETTQSCQIPCPKDRSLFPTCRKGEVPTCDMQTAKWECCKKRNKCGYLCKKEEVGEHKLAVGKQFFADFQELPCTLHWVTPVVDKPSVLAVTEQTAATATVPLSPGANKRFVFRAVSPGTATVLLRQTTRKLEKRSKCYPYVRKMILHVTAEAPVAGKPSEVGKGWTESRPYPTGNLPAPSPAATPAPKTSPPEA